MFLLRAHDIIEGKNTQVLSTKIKGEIKMKRITLKGIALILGLCAEAGLSAGVQADGGYTRLDDVWISENVTHNRLLNIKKDIKKDIKKAGQPSLQTQGDQFTPVFGFPKTPLIPITPLKYAISNNKPNKSKQEISFEGGSEEFFRDKPSIINQDEEIKLDNGSFKDFCQGLDKRLKKVEAQIAYLSGVIEQLTNKGIPNLQQPEQGKDKPEPQVKKENPPEKPKEAKDPIPVDPKQKQKPPEKDKPKEEPKPEAPEENDKDKQKEKEKAPEPIKEEKKEEEAPEEEDNNDKQKEQDKKEEPKPEDKIDPQVKNIPNNQNDQNNQPQENKNPGAENPEGGNPVAGGQPPIQNNLNNLNNLNNPAVNQNDQGPNQQKINHVPVPPPLNIQQPPKNVQLPAQNIQQPPKNVQPPVENQPKEEPKPEVNQENKNPQGNNNPQENKNLQGVNNQLGDQQVNQNDLNKPEEQKEENPPVVNRDDQKNPVEEDQDKQFVEAMKNKVGNARQVIANVDDLLKDDIDV